MADDTGYEKIIQQSLKEELRFLNAQLPGKQRSLGDLLNEDTPFIIATDGSRQLIKKKELEYLSTLLQSQNWHNLMLPVIIEIDSGDNDISIVCRGEEEELIFSAILGMPVIRKQQRIKIHKPQLAVIRKLLKTTTQYLFSPKTLR